ncbi:hypothetical protein [Aquibacillus saliphilus]|uniref:hypothetical protein n=1 Tax=Aquibacillus saliphilus TaxID=1909422 RepID=UPI001CF09545|nr:hypothetical protein [Aquibacillus saliphilus]
MGLFINTRQHPGVFKNQDEIVEHNQGYLKIDYFQELVKEQKRINDSVISSIKRLKSMYHQQEHTQSRQWKEYQIKLEELKESDLQFERFEEYAKERLKVLDNSNMKLIDHLESESLLNQEIMDQINTVSDANTEIVNQLEEFESSNLQLSHQMKELVELNKQMSDQISDQDVNHNSILTSLEDQGAIMEKTSRQLTDFRSILYERTNYIAEKIEKSYKITSSIVYKLFTGSDQPLTFFMNNQREEKDPNNTEREK